MDKLVSARPRGLGAACRAALLLLVAGTLPIGGAEPPGAGATAAQVRLVGAQIELGRLDEAGAALRAALAGARSPSDPTGPDGAGPPASPV